MPAFYGEFLNTVVKSKLKVVVTEVGKFAPKLV